MPIASVTKALLMRHLTVYNRFAMIIAVLTVVFVAALAAQVMVLRNTVIEERRTKVFDLVDAAKKILSNYEEKAKAGKISAEEARQLAFDAIGAMRWGKSADYLGVYGAGSTNAGVTYVHANPKYINVNRWDYKDHKGQLLIQNIVGKARTGGGYLEYQVPKATGGPELPKLTYAGGYGEGDKLLAIQAGVYTDDIDAVVFDRAIWIAAGGLAGLLIAGLAAFALGRGLVRPLGAICGVMDGLAKGDLSVEVPFVEHRNEIGHISRSLAVFKDRLIDAERLRAEREEATARAVAERKSAMNRIACEFEKSVGGIVAGAASAATEMQRSAQSLSAIAKETTRQSTTVAAAAQQTTANVQTVAAAAEELSTSGQEISRQIVHSASIAQSAVAQADRTNTMVEGLAGGDTEDRRGDGPHSKHRRTDQPLGLERDDRGRASRRSRQGLCRRGKRSEGAVDPDRESDGGDRRSDPGDPGCNRDNGRGDSRDRHHHRADRRDRHNDRRRGGGAGWIDQGNRPQRAAGRAGHPGGHAKHCRRDASIGPGGNSRRTGSRFGRRTRKAVRAPEARGREFSGDSPGGVASPTARRSTPR